MRIGFHVSISGRFSGAINRAVKLHCQTMQIFSRNPRGWQLSKVAKKDIEEFKKKRRETGILPLYIHTPYLINLASPDKEIWQKSVHFFIQDLKYSQLIGAECLITHLGSHRGKGEEFGQERVAYALNLAVKKADVDIEILLENTAGQGNSIGYDFKQIKEIKDRIKVKNKVGICLDTAHAFEAGYEINARKGLEETLNELSKFDLLGELELIHLNDSKTALGSRIDRHEHIGKGEIGLKGFRVILNHPRFKKLNFIMETPKRTDQDDLMNLETVLNLIH